LLPFYNIGWGEGGILAESHEIYKLVVNLS